MYFLSILYGAVILSSSLSILALVYAVYSYSAEMGIEITQKPLNDINTYQIFKMPNQLQVLIVTTEKASVSAAALQVKVGHFEDPVQFPGMAHFLQHMLFLGSEKYPSPQYFSNMIRTVGGSYNAFTAQEITNYFFSVPTANFIQVIDIWSRFFIDPTLSKENAAREVNAVTSEWRNGLSRTAKRMYNLIKALSKENHPFHQFSVGNLDTLINRPEISGLDSILAMRDFYRRTYSANRMTLVIFTTQKIYTENQPELMKIFGNITNQQIPPLDYSHLGKPFQRKNTGILVKLEEKLEVYQLIINFNNDALKNRNTQSLQFLKYLLKEGLNPNICKIMEKDFYSLDCNVQFYPITQISYLFSVTYILTQKGRVNIQNLLTTFYSYMKSLQSKHLTENYQKYYQYLASKNKVQFNYQEQPETVQMVSALATSLETSPDEKILFQDFDFPLFDGEEIIKQIDFFIPDNSINIVSNQQFINKGEVVDVKENFVQLKVKNEIDEFLKADSETSQYKMRTLYKIQYAVQTLEQNLIEELKHGKDLSSEIQFNSELLDSLPTVLQIVTENSEHSNPTDSPTLIYSDDKFKLWFTYDTSFQVPRTIVFIRFQSGVDHTSLKGKLLFDIFGFVLEQRLKDVMFNLLSNGCSISIKTNKNGIETQFISYSEHTELILSKFQQVFPRINCNQEEFYLMIEKSKIAIEQTKQDYVLYQGLTYLTSLFDSSVFSREQSIAGLNELQYQDFQAFINSFFNHMRADIYFFGNVESSFALAQFQTLKQTFIFQKMQSKDEPKYSVQDLKGNSFAYRMFFDSVDTENVVVINYFQLGERTIQNNAYLRLIIPVVADGSFRYLRSELQLGYVARAQIISFGQVDGIVMFVQGFVEKPEIIARHMEDLMKKLEKEFINMTPEKFASVKNGAISGLRTQYNTLDSQASAYWQPISEESYDFLLKQCIATFIESITQEDVISYFMQWFKSNGAKLSLQLYNPERQNEYGIPNTLTYEDQENQYHSNKLQLIFDAQAIDSLPFIKLSQNTDNNLLCHQN